MLRQLPSEITMNFMLNLDYDSIMNFCISDINAREICDDDYFWRQMLKRDYLKAIRYKPENITFKQEYKDLHYASDKEKILERGRIDELIAFMSKDIDKISEVPGVVSEPGQNTMMLKNKNIRILDSNDINIALGANRFEIAKWIQDNYNINPDDYVYVYAVKYGNYDLLDTFLQMGLRPDNIFIYYHNYNGDKHNRGLFHYLVKQSNENIQTYIIWLHYVTNDIFNHIIQIFIIYALNKRNFEIIDWIKDTYEISPDAEIYRVAMDTKSQEILDYAINKNINPNIESVFSAIRDDNIPLIEWMTKRNPDIEVNEEWIDIATRYLSVRTLNWLEQRLPNMYEYISNRNFKREINDVVGDFINIYRNLSVEDAMIMQERLINVLQWLYDRKVYLWSEMYDIFRTINDKIVSQEDLDKISSIKRWLSNHPIR